MNGEFPGDLPNPPGQVGLGLLLARWWRAMKMRMVSAWDRKGM
jgi:hypothetical protein